MNSGEKLKTTTPNSSSKFAHILLELKRDDIPVSDHPGSFLSRLKEKDNENEYDQENDGNDNTKIRIRGGNNFENACIQMDRDQNVCVS
jgi:hypothetical protein